MSGLYTLSRIFVAFLGFTALLGVLWFASSLREAIIIAGVLLGISSLLAAFVPQHKLSNRETRRTLIALCVIGIGAGLVLVVDDLGASRGIEWHVVTINLIHVAALATMAVTALKRSSEEILGSDTKRPH